MQYRNFLLPVVLAMLGSCKKAVVNTKSLSTTVTISNKAYPTAVIGTQTWTTVNYDGPGGIADTSLSEATFGKFYMLSELTSLNLPAGWRLPTQTDFQGLLTMQGPLTTTLQGIPGLDSAGTSHLMAKNSWIFPSDDRSGFDAEPAGVYNIPLSSFEFSATAYFLSSTPAQAVNNNQVLVIVASPLSLGKEIDASLSPYSVINFRFSVRFVKDN